MSWLEELAADAAALKSAGRLRVLREIAPEPHGRAVYHGRRYCNFSGNDYMGISGDAELRRKFYEQYAADLSTPELALSETQREMYALNLKPEEFKTSIDDAVNLHRLDIAQIAGLRNARFVCSVWDRENERISDSPFDRGRKVITFNNILKYNTFPLADIIGDILRLGAEEMRCPVEVEFAVNMDVQAGEQQIFNLLQIRPIIDNQDNRPIDWSKVWNPSNTTRLGVRFNENVEMVGKLNTPSRITKITICNQYYSTRSNNIIISFSTDGENWTNAITLLGIPTLRKNAHT